MEETTIEQVTKVTEPWRGPTKLRRVRVYQGSLRDHIRKAETQEELEQIGAFIGVLVEQASLSAGTVRKLYKAFTTRQATLASRLIVRPTMPPLIVAPGEVGR